MILDRPIWMTAWFLGAVGLLLLVFLGSLTLGAVSIPFGDVLAWATRRLSEEDLSARVLSGVRFPRSAAAVTVGAVLGATGASLQSIHRTRIVDAHLIGISAAAGLGVAVGQAFAPSTYRSLTTILLGAVAGAAFALGTRRLGRAQGGTTVLVLMGIAAGFALTAWTVLFVLAVDSPTVSTMSFFIFGSLVGAQWATIGVAALASAASLGFLWWMGPGLDLMALGEQTSIHLGLDTKRRVPMTLVAIGIGVGASVAVGGVIGFVGLIVPLAVRPMVGFTHRVLVPATAIGGAIWLLTVDTVARTLVSPVEIPIGLLTGAVGGPILVWLVRREIVS